MKTKKLTALILVVALSLSLCLPVAAAEKKQPTYITNLISQLQEVIDALEAVIAMLQGIGSDDDAAEAVEDAAAKVVADGFQIGQKFEKGMYRVGAEIPAGEFKITSNDGNYCSYTTYSDSTGSFSSRINGSYTDTFAYFTIPAEAKYFDFSGDGTAEYLGPTE